MTAEKAKPIFTTGKYTIMEQKDVKYIGNEYAVVVDYNAEKKCWAYSCAYVTSLSSALAILAECIDGKVLRSKAERNSKISYENYQEITNAAMNVIGSDIDNTEIFKEELANEELFEHIMNEYGTCFWYDEDDEDDEDIF